MRTTAKTLALALALFSSTAVTTATQEANPIANQEANPIANQEANQETNLKANQEAYTETLSVRRERNSRFIVREGDEAPTFQIVTNDGDTIDSDILRGQVVVLQFAASWCPFSQAQVVDYQELIYDRYKADANFAMFLICEDVEEDRPTFLSQREERGISIPYTIDSVESIYRLFVTPNGSVTRTVVIGPDWRIVQLHDMHTWRGMHQIRKCVGRLLKKMSK